MGKGVPVGFRLGRHGVFTHQDLADAVVVKTLQPLGAAIGMHHLHPMERKALLSLLQLQPTGGHRGWESSAQLMKSALQRQGRTK